jgi:signal transduction histidine kinase
MISILLFSHILRFDLLVWMVGIPVLIIAVITLIFQHRQYKRITAEQQQLLKVKRNAIEYDLVLKTMKLTVWRIDLPTRTITYESDYRDSLGLPVIAPGSDVETFCNLLTPESKIRITAGTKDLIEGKIDEFHEQYELAARHNGKRCWGEVHAVVDKRDLNGKPLTVVGTSVNINRRKEIEQELIEARDKAEENDRLKSAFLANMSHEIRTPLNAIVGFSDVLPMVQSDEERAQLIGLIKQNNAHLLRLFDNMANMAKLETGASSLNKTHFNVDSMLKDLADRYEDACKQKGIELTIDDSSDKVVVYSDYNRLSEIVSQYLNNALKFTEKGTITIGSQLKDERIRIWVRDSGKGIPEEFCNDHLFERFFKLDDFTPGTGLGLSICSSLAKTLEGTVGVESKEGEGSLFWVEIDKE